MPAENATSAVNRLTSNSLIMGLLFEKIARIAAHDDQLSVLRSSKVMFEGMVPHVHKTARTDWLFHLSNENETSPVSPTMFYTFIGKLGLSYRISVSHDEVQERSRALALRNTLFSGRCGHSWLAKVSPSAAVSFALCSWGHLYNLRHPYSRNTELSDRR
jgi:hypothetical protein